MSEISPKEIPFDDIEQLRSHAGEDFGPWGTEFVVTQDIIDRFADITADHQWIHVDVEKARKGPFGTTIAHGFLVLALMPQVNPPLDFAIVGESSRVNYGAESYRFLAPVPSGSTIHARARLVDIRERPQGTLVVRELDLRVLDAPKPSLLYQGMLLYPTVTVTPALANLLVELAGGTLFLRIDRPEKRNALDNATRAALIEGLDWAGATPDVRVVVLTGTGGKAFASGADLSERRTVDDVLGEGRRVYDAVAECARPVVAMIDGYCLGGGCELALSCDLRVASARSRFGQPEIGLGIIPGGGATQRLPRLVGAGQAMRLIATGEIIEAAAAHRLGIVDVLVDDAAELEATTRDLCDAMARHSPVALGLAKQAVRASLELPLADGLAFERELLGTAMASDDGREGIAAFLEKRPPHFKGC